MSKEKYLEIAGQAASLERTREFKPASELWRVAQSLAVTNTDGMWCERRAEICRFMDEKKR